MPQAVFEPAIPATKRPQTYALDREATGIGNDWMIRIVKQTAFSLYYYLIDPSYSDLLWWRCCESWRIPLLSAYQEKVLASNAIYAHAQDFAASDELLLAILKAFIPQQLNKQQTIGFQVFWWIQCDSM
jgi:hypothetical protein